MKKFLLSGFVILSFIGYAIQQKSARDEAGVVSPVIPTAIVPTATNTPAPTLPQTAAGSPPPPTMTPTPGQLAGLYRNGAFIGQVADAYYGNVQIKTIITNGKISDIQFLQYPSDRRTSLEISQQAMPLLIQEAISAQSAHVDGVTGATQTSNAFIESLRSALNQAK